MIKKSSKGQINMSFGLIFSVILVVIFIVFAFYAIKTFLGFENNAKTEKFFSDFQSDVTRIWNNGKFSSETDQYAVPSGITMVCVADLESSARGKNSGIYEELKAVYSGEQNVFFYPVKLDTTYSRHINYLDVQSIVAEENPFCIKTNSGKVSFVLKKESSGSPLVSIGN